MSELRVVEICAGAGGQSLGLHLAKFEHSLAVEIDETAAKTLSTNGRRLGWDMRVAVGDVAAVPEPGEQFDGERHVWNPDDYVGIDLLAGGVPCPPFSIAGKQLGTSDERDLFAWAVELVGRMKPRAVMLENVRGLSMPRFAAYRQWVKDRLSKLGYWSDWKLLEARDYGVPQLRPRFILVALHDEEDARHFNWPKKTPYAGGVGDALYDLMNTHRWPGADAWRRKANQGIAPTIVGGSKKHGGADLGPTRAKRAWAELGVDAMGIANDAPNPKEHGLDHIPKLTIDMVKVLQGWLDDGDYAWNFEGRKTSQYRQIGNAFPPPVARAVGGAIRAALMRDGSPKDLAEAEAEAMQHEPIYVALKAADGPLSAKQLIKAAGGNIHPSEFEQRLGLLSRDFHIKTDGEDEDRTYMLGAFKGFVGQGDHDRHLAFATARNRIS
ncbi:DNA cytosine methyltransferase [Myceligenerans salitolerans]|uniref:Cytosine-specific methyltransferase n=1 Tax=Myceligenerans salitolerans TaxID=1230528 RepID=A0ABS3I3J9_9MICO|nr:DNA (cytosine-5-)-methyltransferase [Myceligenerans salitolerans]MBO0607565.1 DNA (cytosine-5-)-methyltransferase [Myceligenerans salitolerans]